MALLKIFQPAGLPLRLRIPEWMDSPDLDAERHTEALDGLRTLNLWSRAAGCFAAALAKWAPPDRRLRVLDLACGGGDIVLALERKALRLGMRLEVDGCDISQRAIDFARDRTDDLDLSARFFRCDLLKDPLPDHYDVLISSLFLHHLEEENAVALLRRMAKACRVGLLVSDLERCAAGYWLAAIAPRLLTRSAVVHNDAPLSVRAAFRREELIGLLHSAGLEDHRLVRQWPCRMFVSWRKRL